jgi:hypothetical protein
MSEGQEPSFKSIDELRAMFYPGSAPLLDLEADEVVGLPSRMSESALRAVQEIAASSPRRQRTKSGGTKVRST